MGLKFADRTAPGILREPHGEGFRYVSPRGKAVTVARTLKRIEALVIPPAWTKVWIAPGADWHVQATGYDAKGRLQYRYHNEFRQSQEAAKFSKLVKFALALPKLRETVAEHMALPGIPRERALATLVYLLETTLIRIGNAAYAKANESFGLSTLKPDHLEITGATLTFEFTGKSAKKWRVSIRDRRAAAVMRACQELPGQTLFQYLDHDGRRHAVTSADVNAYLKLAAGRRISAKDFRTWAGTLISAIALAKTPPHPSERQLKKQIAGAMREAAKALGNTPAVCRSSYVHPAIFEAHGAGELYKLMAAAERHQPEPGRLKPHEQALVKLLRRVERAQSAASRGATLAAVTAMSPAAPSV